MKKRVAVLAFAFCLFAAGCLAGCGTDGDEKEKDGSDAAAIDVQQLADQLVSQVSFEDQLSGVDQETALLLYGLEAGQIKSCAVYAGTGATAEEVAVFEASDEEAVDAVVNSVNKRVESQLADYADYRPEEVPKLENAVIETSGNYVVLCVCADDAAARTLIKEAF